MNTLVYNNKGFLISGSVVDADMRTISGATVEEVETGNKVQTDIDGKFNINVASLNNTLRFSYLTLDYDEVKAGEFKSLMQLFPHTLDEVPVQNNAKSSNLLLWILGGSLVAYLGYNYIKNKPKKVYI